MTTWLSLSPESRAHYTEILTPLQLDVLRHRLNGHSWRRIAMALDLDESTVRGHHRRALERIRKQMEEAA